MFQWSVVSWLISLLTPGGAGNFMPHPVLALQSLKGLAARCLSFFLIPSAEHIHQEFDR